MLRVKVGNKIYDPNEEPIMLIFGEQEEKEELVKLITDMGKEARKLCFYPDGSDSDTMSKWMKEE